MSHRVPGEALSRRLNAREYRRPKLGFEPSFYARWGLEDPWLNLSDTSWKWADPLSVDDGWSYLSDRAYQQHLARLGFQRWSRQDRYAQWFSDHAERMLGMVERRSGQPSPGRKSLARYGSPTLHHLEAHSNAEPEATDEPEKQTRAIRPLGRPTPGVPFPWGKPKALVANEKALSPKSKRSPEPNERAGSWVRSMEPSRSARRIRPRPLDKLTARLVVQQAPEILSSMGTQPSGRPAVTRTGQPATGTASSRTRLRQVKRQLGPISRLIEPELEQTQSDSMVRPTSVARSRIGTTGDRKRGLRPLMHRSPTMMALDPVAVTDTHDMGSEQPSNPGMGQPTADIHRRMPVETAPQRRLMPSPVSRSAKETRAVKDSPRSEKVRVETTPSLSSRPLARSTPKTWQPVRNQRDAFVPHALSLNEADSPVLKSSTSPRGGHSGAFVAADRPLSSVRNNHTDATVHALSRGAAEQHFRKGSLIPKVAARSIQSSPPSASLSWGRNQTHTQAAHSTLPARGWKVSKYRTLAPEQTPVFRTEGEQTQSIEQPAALSGPERRARQELRVSKRHPVAAVSTMEPKTFAVSTQKPTAASSHRRAAARHALARLTPDSPLAGETIARPSTRRSLLPTVSPSLLGPEIPEQSPWLENTPEVSQPIVGSSTGQAAVRKATLDAPHAHGSAVRKVETGRPGPETESTRPATNAINPAPMQRAAQRIDSPKGNQELMGARDVMERLLRGRSTPNPVGYARLAPGAHDRFRRDRKPQGTMTGSHSAPVPTMLSPVAVDDSADGQNVDPHGRSLRVSETPQSQASRPTAWADARIPPSVSAEAQLRRVLSAVNVFDTPLETLLQSSELARVAAQMSGAEIQGQFGSKAPSSPKSKARIGRFVARTADGRFVSSAWKREKSGTMMSTVPEDTVLRPGMGMDDASMEDIEFPSPNGTRDGQSPDNTGQFLGQQRSQAVDRGFASTRSSQQESNSPGGGNTSRWGRVRSGYGATLSAVQEGQSGAFLPTWARRASGEPLVRDMAEPVSKATPKGELIQSLARASSPEEVIRLMADRGSTTPSAQASLSAPVLKVIEQIRTEAHRVDEAIENRGAQGRRGTQSGRGQKPRSTTRVVRGFTSLSPRARTSQGTGADQISKLARRLQTLITAAEGTGAGRSAARRQVRMAEDSAAARAEGQAAADKGGKTRESQADIDALQREVLSAVTRELEMRRERRMEGGDERDWWW